MTANNADSIGGGPSPDALYKLGQLAIAVLGALAVVALYLAIVAPNISNDVYWHIATGSAFLERGVPFSVDDLGYTFQDTPIRHHAFGFQIFVAALDGAIGFEGMMWTVRVLAYALMLGAFILYCRVIGAPWLLAIVSWIALFVFLSTRAQLIRPEIFGLGLVMAAVVLTERARSSFDSRRLVPLLAVVIAMSFYHTSIIAYVIAFGLFVEKFFRSEMLSSARERLFFFGWGMAFLLSGWLNWDLTHVLAKSLSFESGWTLLIAEFRPAIEFLPAWQFWTWLGICGAAAVLLLWERNWTFLFALVFLTWQALGLTRLVPYSGMIAIMGATGVLARSSLLQVGTDRRARVSAGLMVSGVGLVVSVYLILMLASDNETQRSTMARGEGKPGDVATYLASHYESGNVFTEFETAGFLSYRLAPQFKTFIDGRTNIFYPFSFFQTYQAMLHDPEKLDEESLRYGTDFVVLENHPLNFELVYRSTIFKPVFVGVRYFLASAVAVDDPSLITLLGKPACYRNIVGDSAIDQVGTVSATGAGPMDDWIAGLPAVLAGREPTRSEFRVVGDGFARLAGFVALAESRHGDAARHFDLVQTGLPQDELARSFALAYAGEISEAVAVFQAFLARSSPAAVSDDTYRIARLLLTILQQQTAFDIPSFHAPLLAGNLTPREDARDLVDLFCLSNEIMSLDEQRNARIRYRTK